MTKLTLLAALLASVVFVQSQEKEEASGPEVGKPAPAFRLNDHEGNAVALGGEAKHWTVLAFFPKAMTGG